MKWTDGKSRRDNTGVYATPFLLVGVTNSVAGFIKYIMDTMIVKRCSPGKPAALPGILLDLV
jgi:hypothetical protein